LLQKLAESFISSVFETSESCRKLQKIAIPDRETGLIKALQADAAKKATAGISRGSLTLLLAGEGVLKTAPNDLVMDSQYHGFPIYGRFCPQVFTAATATGEEPRRLT
jgi:hypothetical protein